MTAEDRSRNENKTEQSTVVESKVVAPDGGYGWVVLTASFFISFILDGIMYSFGIILTPIKIHYEAADDVGNLLSSFNTGFLFCSGPIVAGLANQFGCRTVVMGGAIVTSLMYFLTVYAPSIYFCMVFYGIIGGLSTGCTYIASLIIIAEYFDKKRGIATGITMAGSGVGSFMFAPLIEKIIVNYDWKFTMSICACIIMQTCVCGSLLKPLGQESSKKSKQVELKNLSQNASNDATSSGQEGRVIQTFSGSVCSLNTEKDLPFYERNAFLRITIGILKEMTDFKLLLENWGFLLLTISNFFLFTGYFTPFLYITRIAQKNGIANSSYLISIIGIVNIPFRMLYGFIADRQFISAVNLNTLAVTIATVPIFLYNILQYTFIGQAIFSFFFAVGIAGMNSLTTMYLVDVVGMKKFSNATGIINLFRGFGCFLGPFLSGLIADAYSENTAFYFAGICFVVGLVFSVLVSFGSMIKRCLNKSKNDTTAENKTVDDSELNKNLLTKA